MLVDNLFPLIYGFIEFLVFSQRLPSPLEMVFSLSEMFPPPGLRLRKLVQGRRKEMISSVNSNKEGKVSAELQVAETLQ